LRGTLSGKCNETRGESYEDFCAHDDRGHCAEGYNALRGLRRRLTDLRTGRLNLTWPVTKDATSGQSYFLPRHVGAPVLAEDGRTLLGGRSLRLEYPLVHFRAKVYGN